MESCYWNTEISGMEDSQGGEGRTTDEMTWPHAANTYVGWDFDHVWLEDETGDLNGGYPVIVDFVPTSDPTLTPEFTGLATVQQLSQSLQPLHHHRFLDRGARPRQTGCIQYQGAAGQTVGGFDLSGRQALGALAWRGRIGQSGLVRDIPLSAWKLRAGWSPSGRCS